METVRAFHEETKNRPERRLGPHQVAFERQPADNTPITFKEYEGAASVELPVAPLLRRTAAATEVLSGAPAMARALDLAALTRVLAFSAGITRTLDRAGAFMRYFRAVASAHSYPDVYVVCGDLEGLDAGVYYFHGLHLRLDRLRAGDARAQLADAAADPSIARRAATLIITGVPWRAAWRYGERALRHVYWDTGCLTTNMVAVGTADGIAVHVLLGFVDGAVGEIVGADGAHEFPIALVTLGDEAAVASAPRPLAQLEVAPPRISTGTPLVLPLIVDAHHAGDLANGMEVAAWRERDGFGRAPQPASHAPEGRALTIEEVILQRGSTRRMLPDALPRATAEWIVETGIVPPPVDVLRPGCTLVDHFLIVHAIDGVKPGVYRNDGGFRPIADGDMRERTRYVSLQQPQGGDGAFTMFDVADLGRVLGALGPRGYRAAQVEAGYALERLHLAAFAAGTGATGLTFYDDEVASLCGTEAAVMTEVAVGKPSYRAKRGALGRERPTITGRAFDLARDRWKELEDARKAAASAERR